MPLGRDTQYDLSWEEQDKVRRRIELKNRLKAEGIRKKFSPFAHMNIIHFTDPAIDRYADLRKRGRMPGAPLNPKIFYTTLFIALGPIFIIKELVDWERRDYLKGTANGDIPYERRTHKLYQ